MLAAGARGTARPGQLPLDQNLSKELLRFTTAGSVDDGKSTLIGRLLHESRSRFTKTNSRSVKKSRINRSGRAIDFSLLTDGLRAEREQGITIDVAYRYFRRRASEIHHCGHAGPRAVHAEYGHRRVDRRSGGHSGRRFEGPAAADAPSRLYRFAAGNT